MDNEEAKKPLQYKIGQDLSELSVEELNETIHELKQEIIRLEETASQKSSHLSAAEALFK